MSEVASACAMRVVMTVEQCWHPIPGGSGSYVEELGRELAAHTDVSVVGTAARHRDAPVVPVACPVRHSRLPRQVLYEAWTALRRPRVEDRASPEDLVHATTWAVPGRRAPLVVTVHDLAFIRDPSQFTTRGNKFFRRALRIVQDEAAQVIVPSWATRDDCLMYGLEPHRVNVVPHGVRQRHVDEARIAAFRARRGLARDYVLWCGTLEPRKNLPRLLDAFVRLADQHPTLDLVLVGPDGWGDAADRVHQALDRLPDGRVHVLGRLSEADLHSAYAGSRVFVFPSLWEGFGLPVLEAMSFGVPVVTSRGTSMAEFVGDGGLTVDPYDPDDIAAGLASIVEESSGNFSRGARHAASLYTWDESARRTVSVYRAALGEPS